MRGNTQPRVTLEVILLGKGNKTMKPKEKKENLGRSSTARPGLQMYLGAIY